MQVYLGNCAYEIAKKQMKNYLDQIFLNIKYYKWCITTELI